MFTLKKEIIEVACTLSSDSGPYKPLPLNHSAPQHPDVPALNCLRASCFISLALVFLSNMCLKVIASSPLAILSYERFHRKALLSDSGGSLYFVFEH